MSYAIDGKCHNAEAAPMAMSAADLPCEGASMTRLTALRPACQRIEAQ